MLNYKELKKNLNWVGVSDAINVPGFALFSTMVGFSTIAKEAGFDIWQVSATTLTVWGMPGQVAFASLYASGASLIIIFLAVSLANMRMMLMVISGYNILGLHQHTLPLWKKMCLMHIMAITSWAQIGRIKEKYPPSLLLSYYVGFSITIYLFGLSGTILGYFVDHFATTQVLRVITFMTPLYILLLVISSKDALNRLAVLLGGMIIPIIYPVFLDWSILIGGVAGGTLAFGFGVWRRI